jgi:hypothetical protein
MGLKPQSNKSGIEITAGKHFYKVLSIKALFILTFMGALILAFRSPDFGWRSVWAEDGTVFLQQALNLNLPDYFSQAYNGYYFTLHRILIYPSVFLPISLFGVYCFVVAVFNYALCIFTILKTLNGQIPSRFLVILSFVFAGLPIASGEALQNVNNLQWFWYITWTVVTVYKKDPSVKYLNIYRFLSLILVSSAPALLPMLILAKYAKVGIFENKAQNKFVSKAFFYSFILIGLLQNYLALRSRVANQSTFNSFLVASDAFYRIIGASLLGKILYSDQAQIVSIILVVCIYLFLIFLIYIALTIFHSDRKSVVLCIILFIPSLMGIASSLEVYQTIAFTNPIAAGRYFVTCSFGIYFLVLTWIFSRRPIFRDGLLLVFLALFTLSATVNFALNTSRDKGSFQESVRSAKKDCLALDLKEVKIQISPPGWSINLNCEKLK